jgi:hypothetical protein
LQRLEEEFCLELRKNIVSQKFLLEKRGVRRIAGIDAGRKSGGKPTRWLNHKWHGWKMGRRMTSLEMRLREEQIGRSIEKVLSCSCY